MDFKIAIVHDELLRKGGAEKVVLCFQQAFPNAPIYTSAYNENDTYPEFRKSNITTSWFQKYVRNEFDFKRYFFPFGIISMKMLDLRQYNVVLQSGTHCSKYVRVNKDALVLTYCYTPFRLAWNPTSYAEYLSVRGFKKKIFDITISIMRWIDFKAAKRTNFFIGMTNETSLRIKHAYNNIHPIEIIKPPVKVNSFYISEKPEDYYFLISRLEHYKKVDLTVNAFNKLGKKLIIVGKGSKEEELKAMAKSNITFYKGLTSEKVAELYSKCKGFLMPQHEDYGITPLEANASGRPVIAYAQGGVLETMLPYRDDALKCTAVFFEEQTEESLINAVEKFESLTFDPLFIRKHSEKFDEAIFIENIKKFVISKNDMFKSME